MIWTYSTLGCNAPQKRAIVVPTSACVPVRFIIGYTQYRVSGVNCIPTEDKSKMP
jgi:hypothetical protein